MGNRCDNVNINLSGSLSSEVSYPVNLPLGDSSYAGIEVQMLLSSQQVVKGVHLGTVANVYTLITAVNDVYHSPRKAQEQRGNITNM